MNNSALKNEMTAFSPKMTNEDFGRISRYVTKTFGIKLPDAKQLMLEGRLRRRLVQLKMASFREYCEYLFSTDGQADEAQEMIDLVSTNKTDFFREADHFRFLADTILPDYLANGFGGGRSISIWSAGCSTGEECYTLAMVASEFAEHSGMDFSILATDISMRVLEAARMAIYPESRVASIPLALRQRYLMRGKNSEVAKVRFVPEIRRRVKFERLNLMELDDLGSRSFNIIFCRNVIIYFDRLTQEKLISGFCGRLKPGGYLFLGHSESLPGLRLPLEAVAPMVYRKV